ncbi:hypothetical protein Lal_00042502 [Lupinus albus]|nr:hypothetical protein Lal_00042502 [Lupinus albus]
MFPKENGNGYHHHHHHEVPPPGMGNGDGVRRVTRSSRASSPTSTSSDTVPVVRVPEQQQLQQHRPPCTDFDMAYFNSYSHLGIHQEMIKDRVRTETYREAIMRHQSFIAGKKEKAGDTADMSWVCFVPFQSSLKPCLPSRLLIPIHYQNHAPCVEVVLDVGCGTGILSIFCAQAGAKRVYAVDASDIALKANDIVEENNLSDVVIVLHGRVEDVEIDEEVDVIISEWMGYMLLYESMLGSVITARDRWLKPGGLILPSNASLYMAPVTHADRYSEYIDFWRNVYGINSECITWVQHPEVGSAVGSGPRLCFNSTPDGRDGQPHRYAPFRRREGQKPLQPPLSRAFDYPVSPMISLAKQSASEEPSVETITGENILTWPHEVKYIDSYSITIHELETITSSFKFNSMMRASLHGFAFWFDVEFNGPAISPIDSHSTPSSDNNLANGSQRKKRRNPNDALVLSTAPENPPTHWQQTLIYFYEPVALEQDQPIEGSVTLSQNKENARFININLEYSVGGRSYVKQSVMK